jgi:hypothetical protein
MSAGISEPEPAEYYKPYIDDHYTVLGGFDIAKSKSIWIALVAVDGGRGKDIRFYKWVSRSDTWKVDLARMSCAYWDWDGISEKVQILKKKFNMLK